MGSKAGQIITWYAVVLLLVAAVMLAVLGVEGPWARDQVGSWGVGWALVSGSGEWGAWADIEAASAAVVVALGLASLVFWLLTRDRRREAAGGALGVPATSKEGAMGEEAVSAPGGTVEPVVHLYVGQAGTRAVGAAGMEAQMGQLGAEVERMLGAMEAEMAAFLPDEVRVEVGVSAEGKVGIVANGAAGSLGLVFRRERQGSPRGMGLRLPG